MGFLLARAFIHGGMEGWAGVIGATMIVGGLFAAFDEIWQGQVGRHMSLTDWIADAAGLFAAAAAVVRRRHTMTRR